jgi:hypothetical protein
MGRTGSTIPGAGGSAETDAAITGGGATIIGVGTSIPGSGAMVARCRGAELVVV